MPMFTKEENLIKMATSLNQKYTRKRENIPPFHK